MRRAGLREEPLLVVVSGAEDATALGFRGSPTVTVGGADVGDTPEGAPGLEWG